MGMKINHKDENDESKGCRVESLSDCGQAKQHGVQVHDEIFSSCGNFDSNETEHNLNALSCEELLAMSQSSNRPIRFIVKRSVPREKSIKRETHCKHVKDVKRQTEVKMTKTNNMPTKKQIDLALKGKGFPPVPFCKKCNRNGGKSTSLHHCLCPKHQEFDESGAKDKLILILAGIRDGCGTCKYEFAHGKSNNARHISKCGRSQSKLLHCKNSKDDKPKLKVIEPTKIHSKRGKKKSSRKIEPKSKKKKEKESKISTSVSRATSTFIPPTTKKQHSTMKTTEAQEKKSKILNVVPVTPTVSVEYKPCSNTKKALPLCLTDDYSVAQWVSCPNPWGDRLQSEGDFVLMSPACYQSAFDVQGSNPARFITDPFQCNSLGYSKTHKNPQEGYRVLQLRRDKLALRSWGFMFSYHDFGGACLVTEVEALSPAEAAVSDMYFLSLCFTMKMIHLT